jgi:hypothetical protein
MGRHLISQVDPLFPEMFGVFGDPTKGRHVPATQPRKLRAAVAAYVGLGDESSVRRIEKVSAVLDQFEIDKADLMRRRTPGALKKK